MKRVIVAVLLRILAVVYVAAGVDTTLINHSPGKHNPINNKGNLSKCVVYIFDEFNRTLGFGASVPDAEIVVHMKYVKCSQICMVRFQYSGQSGMALVMGIHKSVALLKVKSDKNINVNTIVYAGIVPAKKGGHVHAKSISSNGKWPITRDVRIVEENNDFIYTIKEQKNPFEKEGDLLFFASAVIGILVELPHLDGRTKYQNLIHIREAISQQLDEEYSSSGSE